MDHEAELRENITKIFVILSNREADPERMELASSKMAEVVGVLNGQTPMPEKEKAAS